MFTGIITHIGEIKNIKFDEKSDCKLAILVLGEVARNLEIGCSVACNGICLTLVLKEKNVLHFEASNETCEITTLKNFDVGEKINIEFALRLGDEFGGHIVLGHVDGKAKLKALTQINDSWKMKFELEKKSEDLTKFIAKKGSICLDGISLTVNEVAKNEFEVNVIKHTFANTNFGDIKVEDLVNVEIDTLARYANRVFEVDGGFKIV